MARVLDPPLQEALVPALEVMLVSRNIQLSPLESKCSSSIVSSSISNVSGVSLSFSVSVSLSPTFPKYFY